MSLLNKLRDSFVLRTEGSRLLKAVFPGFFELGNNLSRTLWVIFLFFCLFLTAFLVLLLFTLALSRRSELLFRTGFFVFIFLFFRGVTAGAAGLLFLFFEILTV